MPTFFEKADVSQPNDTTVQVRRSFTAPRDLVYRAHTEPKLVQRWMLGPPGWTMPVCEMDVRTGGKYVWRWRSQEDGKEFGFYGEYTDVEAPKKIVHTEFYDPGDNGVPMGDGHAVISMSLADDGGGQTTLTVLMDFLTKEARDASVATGMTDGMEMGYQRLETEIFAKASA